MAQSTTNTGNRKQNPEHQFEYENQRYEILVPKFHFQKKEWTAAEAAAETSIHQNLVDLAWESNEPGVLRDEADFNSAGFLAIVY